MSPSKKTKNLQIDEEQSPDQSSSDSHTPGTAQPHAATSPEFAGEFAKKILEQARYIDSLDSARSAVNIAQLCKDIRAQYPTANYQGLGTSPWVPTVLPPTVIGSALGASAAASAATCMAGGLKLPVGGLLSGIWPDSTLPGGTFLASLTKASQSRKKIVDEIEKLSSKVEEKEKELVSANKLISEESDTDTINQLKADLKNKDDELQELKTELSKKGRIIPLFEQVSQAAQNKFETDPTFFEQFSNAVEADCFVLAIDIRRSTELMLKANSAKHFEDYIKTLCIGFKDIILAHNGVFDKFTGDGVLAYFPDFYSGDDAGFLAIHAAAQCHSFFISHYSSNRSAFHTVIQDTGLGIGIDCGKANIALISNYTVIGRPVVYACRLSSTDANTTALNQAARDALISKFGEAIIFDEISIDIKHEGQILAYKLVKYPHEYNPCNPPWLSCEE